MLKHKIIATALLGGVMFSLGAEDQDNEKRIRDMLMIRHSPQRAIKNKSVAVAWQKIDFRTIFQLNTSWKYRPSPLRIFPGTHGGVRFDITITNSDSELEQIEIRGFVAPKVEELISQALDFSINYSNILSGRVKICRNPIGLGAICAELLQKTVIIYYNNNYCFYICCDKKFDASNLAERLEMFLEGLAQPDVSMLAPSVEIQFKNKNYQIGEEIPIEIFDYSKFVHGKFLVYCKGDGLIRPDIKYIGVPKIAFNSPGLKKITCKVVDPDTLLAQDIDLEFNIVGTPKNNEKPSTVNIF